MSEEHQESLDEDDSMPEDPPGLTDSDDEEDVPDVADFRLSAKQLDRRKRRQLRERSDLLRSGMELPPATDEDRQGELKLKTGNVQSEGSLPEADGPDAPESKPQDMSKVLKECQAEIEERMKALSRQHKDEGEGKMSRECFLAREATKVMQEEWMTVRRDRRDAMRERNQAGLHVCFRNQKEETGSQPLLTAWRTESQGWHQIEVVLDSGAADSVCPREMCPQYAVEDSDASRAGVYYTGANGGKLYNLGQTHVPVALDNGARAMATFQVAEVSRPLMSVSKVCEMGNRVIFGVNGGYILNLETGGTTQFVKKEGIYIFNMWIPPVSDSPFGRPR